VNGVDARRSLPLGLAALVAAGGLTGAALSASALVEAPAAQAAGPTAHAAATKTVALRGIAFSPKKLNVRRGDRVRFVWDDNGVKHNVVAQGTKKIRFKSGSRTSTRTPQLTKGSRTTLALRKAGTYRYVCTIHPAQMKGSIVVR
jgi:plastocyanin